MGESYSRKLKLVHCNIEQNGTCFKCSDETFSERGIKAWTKCRKSVSLMIYVDNFRCKRPGK
jgi:hypothetical protein